jgi:O-antigen/teichoic acid export membrane protein
MLQSAESAVDCSRTAPNQDPVMPCSPYTRVGRSAAMLGMAGMVESALQLLLPVLLVRSLSQEAFGNYRLVWLLAGTAIAIFPLYVPQSLFHFLPRGTPEDRPILAGNAWLFVIISGSLAAAVFTLAWPQLPSSIQGLQRYSMLAPTFLGLWIMGSITDVLPTADGNARWQATSKIVLAMMRTSAVGITAVVTQDAGTVLLVMCFVALIKTLLVPLYAYTGATQHGLGIQPALLIRQVKYAFPFGVGTTFFLLRIQADGWIVASFFEASVFALLSVASVVLPISTLVRQPLNDATLPRLSMLVGQGRRQEAAELQSRAFAALSLVLLPVLGLLFVVTSEVVELVYTSTYLGAAPLMRIYLVGDMAMIFATGHLLVILNARRLATTISAVCLVISVSLSLAGVKLLGLEGAVIGSVVSLVIGELCTLHAVTRILGTSIFGIMNWSVMSRAVLIVAIAIVISMFSRTAFLLDLPPLQRLIAETGIFLTVVAVGALTTRLHRDVLGLVATLLPTRVSNFRDSKNASLTKVRSTVYDAERGHCSRATRD